MIKQHSIVDYLANDQPLSVRDRLLKDLRFCESYGLTSTAVITIGGTVSIPQQKLFAEIRRAMKGKVERHLESLEGKDVWISVEHSTVAIRFESSASNSEVVRISDLMVLSSVQEERLKAVDLLVTKVGPTAEGAIPLRHAAETRELTDSEVGALFDESLEGVVAQQAHAEHAFKYVQEINLIDLVPESMSYYEKFCGPAPRLAQPEEYLGTVLPDYRKGLLGRDLGRGISICLIGSLRQDLCPGAWIDSISNDKLWEVLVENELELDPFSLLGGLDIALRRIHDDRYREFANHAIEKLLKEEFVRPDGLDGYELLTLFVPLVLQRLNMLEGGRLRPPYWKRMCAWMQATLLLRLTDSINISIEALKRWRHSNVSRSGEYAGYLDLRLEPMYYMMGTSSLALRNEIVSRVLQIKAQHKEAANLVPLMEKIEEIKSRIEEEESLFSLILPGPLEGHTLPKDMPNRTLPETVEKQAVDELARDPLGPRLSSMAYLSQYCVFGGSLLATTADTIRGLGSEKLTGNLEANLKRLADSCLIAVAHRNKVLAQVVMDKVLELVPELRSEAEIDLVFIVVLLSSGAHESEDDCAEWIATYLSAVAERVVSALASRHFLNCLAEFKKCVPITFSMHSKAEAIVQAAI